MASSSCQANLPSGAEPSAARFNHFRQLQNRQPATERTGSQPASVASIQRRLEAALGRIKQLRAENSDLARQLETAYGEIRRLRSERPLPWKKQFAQILGRLARMITGTLDPHLARCPHDEWAQLASAQLTGVRATLAQLTK